MTPSAPQGSAFATLFEALASIGVEYAGSISAGTGGKFACPNPDHEDEHASFDVHIGRNGKPIFTCTPCRDAMGQDDFIGVLRDAGVRWQGAPIGDDDEQPDWGPAAVVVNPTTKGGKGGVHLTAVYTYKHADGTPNFKVRRFDPDEGSEARKHFRPQGYRIGHGWKGGSGALDDIERTPYYLDRFEVWAGQPIYMVEGEKAADALVADGYPATTFHGGTSGKAEEDWPTRYGFDRFPQVLLWPDADEAGVERMIALAGELRSAGHEGVEYWGAMEGVQAKDDAYDALKRRVHFGPLTDADLDYLKALHPKPVVRNRSVEKAESLPDGPTVNGKGLMPARSPEAAGGPQAPRTQGTDGIDPYATSIGQAPYEFVAEMVEREFMTDGVLTLRFRVDDRMFWLWDETRYVLLSEPEVRALVKKRLKDAWETFYGAPKDGVFPEPEARKIKLTKTKVSEVIDHLQSLTLTSVYGAGALVPNVGGVPFLNGWLDVESGDLTPITPNRDVRWNVPAEYDPKAKCPEWIGFLKSLGWGPGTQEYRLLQQWLGYVISGAITIHKGLILIGPKRGGKGTILGVAEALMGEGAVGIQLDAFQNNFGMQNLIGKGLATIGDARFGFRTDKAIIERLLSLTSFDLMQIDAKWEKPYSIRLGSRLMIATNEVPAFIEASDALASRFLILELTKSFYGQEDLTLKRRLMKELPGIARWALVGYKELIGLGSFTETDRGLAVQQQMVLDAAPIRVFVEEECVLDPGRSVECQMLFDRYLVWAEKANTYKLSRSVFFRDLQTAYPGKITDLRKRVGGSLLRCKSGIGVR